MLKSNQSFITRFWMASIRRQLILGIALVHAVLMTIFVFDLVDRQSDFLYEQSIAQAEGLAKTLATTSSSWVLSRDIAGLDEVLQSQAGFPSLRYAMVLTPRGKVIAHIDSSKNNLYLSDKVSQKLLNSSAELQTLVSDNALVDLAYPILVEDELIGWARVGIGQEIISDGLLTISRNGIIYTLLAIVVGSVFAYFMAKSLTGSLRHLVNVVEENRLGNREQRTDLNRDDEIGLLGQDFNLMLDALEQQEKEIRDRELELRKISDVLPAPVARVNVNQHYLFVSAAYERWFGKQPKDVVGHHVSEFVSEEIFSKVSPYFDRALKGETDTFEITNKTASGETLYGQVTVVPDYDNSGSVCGFYTVFADITERTLAEKELKKSQQQAKDYLNVAAVMLISLDTSGNITLINQKGCEMLGLHEQDILGKNWFDNFLPVSDIEQVKTVHKQLMAGDNESFEQYENLVKTGRGDERLYSWKNSLLRDGAGRIIGVLSSADDITEIRAAERDAQALRDQLVQATKMEAVGHLTAGIAHDFNNILSVIMGYTELSKEIVEDDNGLINKYLNEIEKSGQRATELVSQMLSFSRLSPELEGGCAPVTLLAPVVKEVVSLLRSTIPSTIELNCQIDSPDIKACIEQIQFHQIILNLGINARDAIGSYGTIDCTVGTESINSRVCMSCQHEYKGDFVKITVRDSGDGIDEHLLKNIFDPFFTTKDVGKGTGMGLSVVHGLVHKAGGHIHLESIKGKGTTITILLPVASRQQEVNDDSAISHDTEGDLTGLRIMVVDDEPAIADMLDDLLTRYGAQVKVYFSPLEAWSSFEGQPDLVDVVITDETMPGLTGMHLSQKMLMLKPELPIILCTGYSDNITIDSAKEAGLSGYFNKPTDIKLLVRKLQELCE